VRSASRIAWPALASAFLAGCVAVGPDFVTPQAPRMSNWTKAAVAKYDQYAGVTERREPAIEWWRTLNDPVLNELIAIAQRQNLGLQIAGIRIYQARAQLGIVIGDKFPQTQQVGASYKSEKLSEEVGLIKKLEDKGIDLDPNFQTWAFGFDAAWELDVWGQVRRGIQAANANLVAQIANYDDVFVTLTGDVATAYVTIRELQDELALMRANVKTQSDSLGITQLRFDNGVTTELDVDEAKSLLATTQANIPAIESDLAQAKNALGVLLGMTPGQVDPIVNRPGGLPRPSAEIAVGIPVDLLRRRPDIRAAEMEAAAAAAQVGVAEADLYPQFGISGSVGFKASDFSDLFNSRAFTGLINPGITWNFLNYGRIKNNVRVQDAKYQEAIVEYQRKVLKAYAEVESALSAFLLSKQEAIYLSRATDSSKKAVGIAIKQYQEGTADFSRVLNSENAVLHSQERLAQARAEVVLNLVALYKGLGGGWQPANFGSFISASNKEQMATRTKWGRLLDDDAIPPEQRALLLTYPPTPHPLHPQTAPPTQ
jgi:NodT family efflux transporter outer membrane factor (OMF) lipoprotein